MEKIIKSLMQEFRIKEFQVQNTIKLIDEGNTIPFIARYRKEMTGELDDIVLRELNDRLTYLRNLEARKEEVIRLIDEQDKLTEELEKKIKEANVLQEVEDYYLPYKKKRRTRATIAKEKGLEPLAEIIMDQRNTKDEIQTLAEGYISEEKEVTNRDEAIAGAMDIIAEMISDSAAFRKKIRNMTAKEGKVVTKGVTQEQSEFEMYYDFREPISKIAHHRVLALNRGEKKKVLQVKIEAPEDKVIDYLIDQNIKKQGKDGKLYVEEALKDAYKRLISPSIEREMRNMLTEAAEEQAIKVFATNLKNLLLQPPVPGKVTMGFDPAFRSGCKIAVVNEYGTLLDTTTIYPTAPQNKVEEGKKVLLDLIHKYKIQIISIGNGTASRESEKIVADMIGENDLDVKYVVVNEAGASVYSASKLGTEEYPDINVSLRGAISIARRLQDPLAELVKIDPKHIGVGQYQHDVTQKKLDEALKGVVEDAVNTVGVDVNTASPSLLKYVSGINAGIAKNILAYREENGAFTGRKQFKKVKKLGEKAFTQSAGFLRISDSPNVLDRTGVHPESYEVSKSFIEECGFSLEDLMGNNLEKVGEEISSIDIKEMADKLKTGEPTLRDIIKELKKPGRDPREEMPQVIFRQDVMEVSDLKSGMELVGTVRNVIDFGAFVDIGVHQDGLVHISQLSDRFVKNPMDVVSVGDIVKVQVLEVDVKRNRIALTMKGIK